MHQQATASDFSHSASWVILAPIERSIKAKIEAVGTPLKDWDIQIYRGILTGCNEAFIITTEKRDEILANCATEEERQRTEDLIRPILRGRDIKRYGYEWAGLYLINAHNGVRGRLERIHIEDYPAVKTHLDQYWTKLVERADQGDTPYNLRNCAYVEDFNKPKMIYMEIQTNNPKEGYPFPCFSYDEKNCVIMNTGYILSSGSIDVRYILGILNSRVGKMIAKIFVTQLQERQYRMLAQYVRSFPIPMFGVNGTDEIIKLVKNELTGHNSNNNAAINQQVLQLYRFSPEEIEYIENGED